MCIISLVIIKNKFFMLGPSQCGKTSLVFELIKRRNEIINEQLTSIIYIYGVDTLEYHKMKTEHPEITFLAEFDDSKIPRNSLVIFDDRMSEIIGSENKSVTQFITRTVHHKKCSAILIFQNIFAPKIRTITLNSQYIVFFKTPRDCSSVAYLSKQMYPGKKKFLSKCYEIATKRAHSYLFIDLSQTQVDSLRVRSDIFPVQGSFVFTPEM